MRSLSQLIGSTLALEYMRAGMLECDESESMAHLASRIRCAPRIHIINLQLPLREIPREYPRHEA